ncbi:MAG: hypothetical protein LBU32_02200 [Clostridiales bacterium]|nr:hypothetical protein [Clostridiales bacterium]
MRRKRAAALAGTGPPLAKSRLDKASSPYGNARLNALSRPAGVGRLC